MLCLWSTPAGKARPGAPHAAVQQGSAAHTYTTVSSNRPSPRIVTHLVASTDDQQVNTSALGGRTSKNITVFVVAAEGILQGATVQQGLNGRELFFAVLSVQNKSGCFSTGVSILALVKGYISVPLPCFRCQ